MTEAKKTEAKIAGDAARTQVAILAFYTQMDTAYRTYRATGYQREGQAWMNALHQIMPAMYEKICGTSADCFNDDSKVDAFKRAVFGGGE